jgi:cyclic pyranopterin phosphate synthase
MPREQFGPDHAFLPRAALLSFEEIERVAVAAAACGVRKLRLTGGEPLLRSALPALVAKLTAVDGIDDVALTTNASLLTAQAEALRAAGLHRLTVSLDALDEATFHQMADTRVALATVLEGMDAAEAAGFPAVKVNCVVRRGVNDHQVLDMAAWGRERGRTVRFIEYMDVGSTNGWRLDEVVPSRELLECIAARWPLEPLEPVAEHGPDGPSSGRSQVAERWRYRDGGGEVGLISSVTRPFCATCTRARLSAVGELYTCLFATRGHDLRAILRGGASDADLRATLAGIWGVRTDAYSEHRSAATSLRPKVEMSYIGG